MSGSDNPPPLFHFTHCSHPQTERKQVDVSIVCKREFGYLGGVALYFFSWRSEVFIAALIHQLPTHCVVLMYQQRKWICCSISPRWYSMPPMCPYYWTVGGVQLSKSAFTAVSQWPLSRPLDKGTVFSTLSSVIKEFPLMNTSVCDNDDKIQHFKKEFNVLGNRITHFLCKRNMKRLLTLSQLFSKLDLT